MTNTVKISEKLSELMLENEKDVKTLAKAIGVDVTTVYRWKRNAKYMLLSQILKLADYFNCSLDFITGRSETLIDFTPQVCPPFYEHFRKLIETKGISRNKINKETRIKSSHFVDWKNGSDPHILSLIELANYLDCSLDYLVGRDS